MDPRRTPAGSRHRAVTWVTVPFPRRVLIPVCSMLLLAGCFTGERPTLADPAVGGEPGTPTGDAAVDAVLAKLETSDRIVFSATYTITRAVGPVTTTATVSQDASRRSVTIGDIRYLSTANDLTCDLVTATCEPGLLDARVSDTGVTHEFAGGAAARRLRISASRATGPTTAETETVAGYPSTCVTVPVGAGSERYCANDLGVVSRMLAADVTVELTAVSPSATEELFSTVA